MGKILEVKNLTVHIKTHKGVVQAVRGVDFYLNEQETCLLYTSPSPRDTR